jgi:hypothetical protein
MVPSYPWDRTFWCTLAPLVVAIIPGTLLVSLEAAGRTASTTSVSGADLVSLQEYAITAMVARLWTVASPMADVLSMLVLLLVVRHPPARHRYG